MIASCSSGAFLRALAIPRLLARVVSKDQPSTIPPAKELQGLGLEAPACPDALGPRAPMVEQAAQRTPDGDRKNSETDKPNRRLTPNTDIAGLV